MSHLFAKPELLWLLLVIPPGLATFFWWSWRKKEVLMARFITGRLLPGLVAGTSRLRLRVRLACLVLATVFIIVALAGPQWGFTWQEVKQRGVDIVVAVDCSKSMLATDITPSRLARAKLAALELMQKARTDRLGLVAFAGSAFLVCPLTIDDVAFAQSVEALNVGTVSQGGTAIAEAINTAVTAFKEGDNHKLLVLMTDGEDHDSGALKAAELAAQAGLRIFTIGVGTAEGELVRFTDPGGRSDYVRDEEDNVVKSRLDERLLNEIAAATAGGFYLPLRGAKTIDTLYEKGLESLPKSEHQERLVKQYHQRFHWPLAMALLFLIVETLLPERRRLASGKGGVAKAASVSGAAAVVVALLWATPGSGATPSGALREYKAGRYDQAVKDYEELLKRKSDDPRLRFNAGTAAYRNGQYEDAAKQFDSAIASPDLKLQESAFYNRGNSLFWLGEQSPDPAQRKQNWEKALKDFDLSMKLNPTDTDAKFNHEFVKKRLEELKQQQQQNQSQKDKSDQQNEEQQQQQQGGQSNQDQKQQDQSQQQQQQQEQQKAKQQRQDTPQPQPEKSQQQQEQQNQSSPAQQEKQKEQPEQQMAQSAAEQKQQEKEEQAAAAAGQMTPEQARQLLDSQKGQEKMLSQKLQKPADRTRRFKDW